MTPELPRAPISEPRLIAWHTSAIDSAVAELGAHRLERERHVRAGVAVGDRVDVEPVQLFLVGAQRVAEAQHRLAQVGGAEAGQRRHRAGEIVLPAADVVLRFAVLRPVRSAPSPTVRSKVQSRWLPSATCAARSRSFGMRLSHSHRRTKRRWNPNIQRVRAVVNGTPKRLNVCTSCLKAGKVAEARLTAYAA